MKYLLFAGMDYYANGGWWDYKGMFDSVHLAKEHFKTLKNYDHDTLDWAHIVSSSDNSMVTEYFINDWVKPRLEYGPK